MVWNQMSTCHDTWQQSISDPNFSLPGCYLTSRQQAIRCNYQARMQQMLFQCSFQKFDSSFTASKALFWQKERLESDTVLYVQPFLVMTLFHLIILNLNVQNSIKQLLTQACECFFFHSLSPHLCLYVARTSGHGLRNSSSSSFWTCVGQW